MGNPNFGKAVDANGNLIYSLYYAEQILKGWDTQPSDWVGKVLRFGRQRATVSLAMFNALNADIVLTCNQSFTPGGA